MFKQNDVIKQLVDAQMFSELDAALARFFLDAGEHLSVAVFAGYVSNQLSAQQSCVEIPLEGQPLHPVYDFSGSLAEQLSASSLVSDTLGNAPLVIEDNRVYLQRIWQYESRLAEQICALAGKQDESDSVSLAAHLNQLFAAQQDGHETDWQRVAVAMAACQRLAVITGGPGTGKTTTVTKLLALLQAQQQSTGKRLNIVLAAPTGKAAARLSESINGAIDRLPSQYRDLLHSDATTLHRLMGSIPGSSHFRHDNNNPLNLDVLLIDEASMVDLPLMSKIFDALPDHAKVVLLGDKNQLASVEVGSVLNDLCEFNQNQTAFDSRFACQLKAVIQDALPEVKHQVSRLQNNIVVLQKSHRFDAQGGIGQLATAVLNNQPQTISAIFAQHQAQLIWHKVLGHKQLLDRLTPQLDAYFDALNRDDIDAAFEALLAQQVLCATRKGQLGVENINRLVEEMLLQRGWVNSVDGLYQGRALMVTENDHQQGIFNGDIGIVWPNQQGLLKVWFIAEHGQLRQILPSRVPGAESLYAMTVHKSQGSEFKRVILCLPSDDEPGLQRGLNRELIYTAITRAKSQFELCSSAMVLHKSIGKHCKRASGLAQRLGVANA